MKPVSRPTKINSFKLVGIFIFLITSVVGCALAYQQSTLDKISVKSANINFAPNLAAYNIYKGVMSDLIPANDVHPLELSTALFTDYAEKQRLVKVPAGTMMYANGDGLPDFPNGTILVKTFYYYDDVRKPDRGKRIIETRLEIKQAIIKAQQERFHMKFQVRHNVLSVINHPKVKLYLLDQN